MRSLLILGVSLGVELLVCPVSLYLYAVNTSTLPVGFVSRRHREITFHVMNIEFGENPEAVLSTIVLFDVSLLDKLRFGIPLTMSCLCLSILAQSCCHFPGNVGSPSLMHGSLSIC